MLALASLLCAAGTAYGAVVAEGVRVPILPPVAAPAIAARASLLSTPALAPTALAASAPAPAAPSAGPAAAAPLPLVERRGVDRFGHEVFTLDALDPVRPELGAVGHVDVSLPPGQARLDGPLDHAVPKEASGAPEGADLSHFREHLWFGLAVLPSYRDTGLGTRLLREAVARMRAHGARRLYVRATETSLPFYRKRFGKAVRSVEEERGDEETLYRVEVDLDALD